MKKLINVLTAVMLLCVALTGCGTKNVPWPDNVVAVDVSGGAEGMLTITCITPESQEPFSVELSLNQLKSLKSVLHSRNWHALQ